MKSKKYYYTFGSSATFPFQNGWVTITAPSRNMADALYMELYPCPKGDPTLNCSFVYTEKEFQKTNMVDGNLGAKCHASYVVTVVKE